MRTFRVISASLLLLSACIVGEGAETDALGETGRSIHGEEHRAVGGSRGESDTGAPPATRAEEPRSARVDVVGAWVSPFCGERSYARTIRFDGNGGFVAQDLVSPCPQGVTCFWSGIVHKHGVYEIEGRVITLDIEGQGMGSGIAILPTRLLLDPATSAPAELTPEGAWCIYERASNAPKPPDERL